MNQLLQITSKDNVAVVLSPLAAGSAVQLGDLSITAQSDIPAGHKIALKEIAEGELVIKYGFPIGYAKEAIHPGDHVHVHNIHTNLSGELEYTWQPSHPTVQKQKPRSFNGYKRSNGKVGIRNELWIIPTVGCVNDIARTLEQEAQTFLGAGIDRICAFRHPYGCSQMGDDQENTRNVLADRAMHPNAGGVLLLGLGCENSGVQEILSRMQFLTWTSC